MIEFKRSTHVKLPYDMRHTDANKNYGIHGLDVWFVLEGPKGAVQYAVTFGIYLPNVQEELENKNDGYTGRIRGFDVGYHSPTPHYEGQMCMGECPHIGGKPCYYDGSSLRAEDWTETIFATTGKRPEEVLWPMLETEYKERFGND